jgi:putative ABC transport system permease protein
MTSLRVWLSRAYGLFGSRRRDADLRDEIQAHLDLLADDHVRCGMSVADVRVAARRNFGSVEQVKEVYREQRRLAFLDTLARDIQPDPAAGVAAR